MLRDVRIALIHNARLPVEAYGGTERVVWWLAKGLHEAGHHPYLVCAPGSECAFAEVHPVDFQQPLAPQLPEADVLHYFNTPPGEPERPYIVTIEGNGKAGESFFSNTVFVSRNHAERHGGVAFVYNGIDPAEYRYSEHKRDYLIFLAKAAWRVKNVKGAIRVARRARSPLHVLGGSRWLLRHWRGVHWEGMIGGESKTRFLESASGLLFPVIWHEPFGIAVVEALVSGTPVVATPFGSLPELVPPSVGVIGRSERELLDGVKRLPSFRPRDCREWALEQFHYRRMARRYLECYEKVLNGRPLNPHPPMAEKNGGELLSFPR